jgi:arylsulfatase A-like enzyme
MVVVGAGACHEPRESSASREVPAEDRAAASASAAPKLAAAGESGRSTTGSGKAGPPADLNVIVLSIDSLRADMPWAGYPRAIAPRLTELEKQSVSYTRAYAVSSYTSMSLGGFLSGKLPSELKRSGYFFGTYPASNLFFPEILQSHGIVTLGAHAHTYFGTAGFQQGFDVWELVPNLVANSETDVNVTSPLHEAMAERLLSDSRLDTTRFFAWFHFLDPHDRYMPHEKDGIAPYGKSLRDRYDAEVTFTDRWIGKLLDFVATKPWSKHTAIVVTSDHGEAFGEHGRYAHGFELWENLVRVPLFFVVPGVSPRHIDTPRSAVDLAPTLVDLFGIKPDHEAGFAGKSLVPEIYGDEAPARDVVVDLPMTSNNDKRRALIVGKWKIIAFGKTEVLQLFDLEADPEERSPITKGDDFDAMAKRYREFSKTVHEVAPYACGEDCLNGAYMKKKSTP